jgi:hypothetical protein
LGLLVVACLVLGISLAWGQHARHQAERLAGELEGMRVQLALSAAGDSQLTALLTSDSAELIRLQPTKPQTGQQAALVWDRKLGNGFLFCQGLWPAGAGQQYHLVIESGPAGPSGAAEVAAFDAQTGTTVVRFHAPKVPSPVHFELKVGARGSQTGAGEVLFTGKSSPMNE